MIRLLTLGVRLTRRCSGALLVCSRLIARRVKQLMIRLPRVMWLFVSGGRSLVTAPIRADPFLLPGLRRLTCLLVLRLTCILLSMCALVWLRVLISVVLLLRLLGELPWQL